MLTDTGRGIVRRIKIRFHGGPNDGQLDDNAERLGVGGELCVVKFPVDFADLQPGVAYDGRFDVYAIRDADETELHAWYIGERTPRELGQR